MNKECEHCKKLREELEQWKKEALIYRGYHPSLMEGMSRAMMETDWLMRSWYPDMELTEEQKKEYPGVHKLREEYDKERGAPV